MNSISSYTIREYGAKAGKFFLRNIILRDENVYEFRSKYKNTDVYYCIYRQCDVNRSESLLYGEFYLDIDKKDASSNETLFEEVRQDALAAVKYMKAILYIPEEFINIYFSGNKGIHITVHPSVFGILPSPNLNQVYKLLAEDICNKTKNKLIDMQIYDARRLFRLPNSINEKTSLYKVRISERELAECSLDEIRQISKSNRVFLERKDAKTVATARAVFTMYQNKALMAEHKTYKETDIVLTTTPPCIDYLMKNKVKEGQRNNTAIAIASFFKQRGYNIDEATTLFHQWVDQHCDPPLTSSEINVLLRQAFNNEYKYGCNKLKMLAECNAKKCELRSE